MVVSTCHQKFEENEHMLIGLVEPILFDNWLEKTLRGIVRTLVFVVLLSH